MRFLRVRVASSSCDTCFLRTLRERVAIPNVASSARFVRRSPSCALPIRFPSVALVNAPRTSASSCKVAIQMVRGKVGKIPKKQTRREDGKASSNPCSSRSRRGPI
eukprot:scaffold338_cov361-Pavlova_lutheri.AAC.9